MLGSRVLLVVALVVLVSCKKGGKDEAAAVDTSADNSPPGPNALLKKPLAQVNTDDIVEILKALGYTVQRGVDDNRVGDMQIFSASGTSGLGPGKIEITLYVMPPGDVAGFVQRGKDRFAYYVEGGAVFGVTFLPPDKAEATRILGRIRGK